jgi:glutathione S-transferase
MAKPILYSFRRCPYAMRARLALLASGTTCELREVKLSAKPEVLLAASPKATVPVLVLPDGRVIDESLDIMHWALTPHDPGGWLGHDDAALIAANDGRFKHHLDRYKYPARHGSDPVVHRAAGLAFVAEIEAALGGNAWLGGAAQRLTDAAIMPFVRQFAEVDRRWFDAQALPGVQHWLAASIALPGFEAAMVRHPCWRPGNAPVMFGQRDWAAMAMTRRAAMMFQ